MLSGPEALTHGNFIPTACLQMTGHTRFRTCTPHAQLPHTPCTPHTTPRRDLGCSHLHCSPHPPERAARAAHHLHASPVRAACSVACDFRTSLVHGGVQGAPRAQAYSPLPHARCCMHQTPHPIDALARCCYSLQRVVQRCYSLQRLVQRLRGPLGPSPPASTLRKKGLG